MDFLHFQQAVLKYRGMNDTSGTIQLLLDLNCPITDGEFQCSLDMAERNEPLRDFKLY